MWQQFEDEGNRIEGEVRGVAVSESIGLGSASVAAASTEVLTKYRSTPEGLSSHEANARRQQPPYQDPRRLFRLRLRQHTAQMIKDVIPVATLVSAFFLGIFTSYGAMIVLFSLVAATFCFGFVAKSNTSREFHHKKTQRTVRVVRDGQVLNVIIEALVEGDLFQLSPREHVPTACSLYQVVKGDTCQVFESAFPGEVLAVTIEVGSYIHAGSVVSEGEILCVAHQVINDIEYTNEEPTPPQHVCKRYHYSL